MPLHAISAVYGEQGLRARLAIETARLGDPPSRQKVSEALELAGVWSHEMLDNFGAPLG